MPRPREKPPTARRRSHRARVLSYSGVDRPPHPLFRVTDARVSLRTFIRQRRRPAHRQPRVRVSTDTRHVVAPIIAAERLLECGDVACAAIGSVSYPTAVAPVGSAVVTARRDGAVMAIGLHEDAIDVRAPARLLMVTA